VKIHRGTEPRPLKAAKLGATIKIHRPLAIELVDAAPNAHVSQPAEPTPAALPTSAVETTFFQ
jgi:hypothetical protein